MYRREKAGRNGILGAEQIWRRDRLRFTQLNKKVREVDIKKKNAV